MRRAVCYMLLICLMFPAVSHAGVNNGLYAAVLDAQLEQVAIDFINDEKSNYLAGNKLYVSKVFNWFSEDFPEDFPGWLMLYAQGSLKSELQA
ncbi:MAG: hypothetical protein JEY79_19410 [Pseudodesulfovibrio sp.]|nr:hypothetical protein [Pseudodesulfovibrio sp.]